MKRRQQPAYSYASVSRGALTLTSDLPSTFGGRLISRRHVRDQDPLGPSAPRQRRRARLRLGGDAMDRMAARLPAAARTPLVRALRRGRSICRRPSSGGGIAYDAYAPRRLRRRRLHRRVRRDRRDRRGDRDVGLAGARGEDGSPPTARRAGPSQREVRRAGLLGADGVVLGRWRDEYLRHDGPEHVLCFAPTRSAARASASSCRRC